MLLSLTETVQILLGVDEHVGIADGLVHLQSSLDCERTISEVPFTLVGKKEDILAITKETISNQLADELSVNGWNLRPARILFDAASLN